MLGWVAERDPRDDACNPGASQFRRMARRVYPGVTDRTEVPARWPEQPAWSNLER